MRMMELRPLDTDEDSDIEPTLNEGTHARNTTNSVYFLIR